MSKLMLNDDWLMREQPLSDTKDQLAEILRQHNGWYTCSVPCDVSMPLIAAGVLQDPAVADHCFQNEWVEQRSWWFQKSFRSEELPPCDVAELVFRSLDCNADIYLNGVWLGHHANAHREFRKDVRKHIVEGKNVLAVRLTVGLETVSDADLAELNWAVCTEEDRTVGRGDKRRAFLRKPQYVFGWDWSPRVATCGIMDDVYIEAHTTVAIRGVSLATEAASAHEAVLRGELEVENLSPLRTCDADVVVDIKFDGVLIASATLEDQLLCSGLNYLPFTIRLQNPRLWYPNGCGEQPLYDVGVLVAVGEQVVTLPDFAFGVRTVSLDCHRIDAEHRHFALVVNGREIFCKGGDWVPADPLYARVTDEKLETLVSEAAEAHFNMLRIWGGGIYNREAFYHYCDAYGILLWHDFMFACSTYPDHRDAFTSECERELDYQTRRLRNHACIGLFCGNNEDHEIFNWDVNTFWGIRGEQEKQYGLKIANWTARQVIRRNCPYIPYWNSSPYGGTEGPTSQNCGDVHYWGACMMNADMTKRIEPKEYDKVTARFVSEYGYPGPTCIETIRDYFGGHPIERGNAIWNLHNNTFEKETVEAGIRKHYTDETLSLDQYILYAGMVQGTMLGYSLESLRFKTDCSGGIFWMYNDCWGEVGWTIIDYYLRRKIAYYAVRRAFAPNKLILRAVDGRVVVVGANDTGKSLECTAELGWISFDGTIRDTVPGKLTLPPHSRGVVWEGPLPDRDETDGVFAILPDAAELEPAVLRLRDARGLAIHGSVRLTDVLNDGNDLVLTLEADTYTHGVYFDADYQYSDNYFDLLPGQHKTVTVYGAAGQVLEPKKIF